MAVPAFAAGQAPPFEFDGQSLGQVVFYDAQGNVVTSGTNDVAAGTVPFAYAVAPSIDTNVNTAQMVYATPHPGEISSVYPNFIQNSSPIPNTALPADLAALAATHDIVATNAPTNAGNIQIFNTGQPTDTTAGYANVIQVRVTDSGPRGAGNAGSGTYWSADIAWNNTSAPITVLGTTVPANGWAQVFPVVTQSTTTLTNSASGGQAVTSQTLTLTAQYTPTTAAGTVNFFEDGTLIGSTAGSAGTATFTTDPLTVTGSHSFTASFSPTLGDVQNGGTVNATMVGGSTSAAASVTVGAAHTATTTNLTATPDTSTFGGTVNLKATVTDANSNPGVGKVQFKNGSTNLGSPVATDSTGVATAAVTNLPGGTDSVTAVFTPTDTATFSPSTSDPATINVAKAATATTTTVSPTTLTAGQQATLTATVAPATLAGTAATGTVSFSDGTSTLCSAPVSAGTASCKATIGTAGTETITATYAGDNNFAGSVSPGVPVTVGKGTTTTAITANPTGSVGTGQSVTYTATVTPASASGTVAFNDGTGNPATQTCSAVTIASGKATCTVTYSTEGTVSVSATYGGNNNFGGSTSPAITEAVKAPSTTSLTSSATGSVTVGAKVTYTATVSPAGATGTVTFMDGTRAIANCGTVTLSNASATCTATFSTVGAHSITAKFSGDAALASSVSTALSQQVTAAPATAPTAPKALTATAGDGQVTLKWSAPASNGGSPITGYNVFGATTSGGEMAAVAFIPGKAVNAAPITARTFTVKGLTNNTTYFFVVEALNKAGHSGPSNQVSAKPAQSGYVLITKDGHVFAFGTKSFGSLAGKKLSAPIVAAKLTPDHGGYWMVAADGGVFAFGDAPFVGSLGDKHLNAPITGMATTASGKGYWLFAGDGGVFTFGDAKFDGSLGAMHLNGKIVGAAATPDGKGYWMVGADGGVFALGGASFAGSLGGTHLNSPVVSIIPTASGKGYWMVAADGGVFAFGDAKFFGSMGGKHLNAPIIGATVTSDGAGYTLIASDGGVFTFGDAKFQGSLGGTTTGGIVNVG